jgi:hypothetical protein
MISLQLRVPCDDTWKANDRVQVYTDYGTGELDMDAPLLSRPLAMFPGVHFPGGYGRNAYGSTPYGNRRPAWQNKGGYGRTKYGSVPYGQGEPYINVSVDIEDAHGDWTFGVEVVDGAGNPQSGAVAETTYHVSGEDPAPAGTFAFSSYDSESDQCEFTIGL